MPDPDSPRHARDGSGVSGLHMAPAVASLRDPVYIVDPGRRSPARATLAIRPFGYLAMAIIWAVLNVVAWVIVFIGFALPALAPLGAQPGLQRAGIGGAIVLLLVAGPLAGGAGVVLVCGTTGLLLSYITFFVRGLRRSYRDERLSVSVLSVGAEAIGLASAAGFATAFSAIPVRLTRWSKTVVILTSLGFVSNVEVWAIGVPWGLFTTFTGAWIAWPVRGGAVIACAAVSAALLVFSAWVIWRRRHAYPNIMPAALRGTVYEWSWPNVPSTAKAGSAAHRSPRAAHRR